jgi:hypothetical protein
MPIGDLSSRCAQGCPARDCGLVFRQEVQFVIQAVEKQPRFCSEKSCTIGSPAEAGAKILGDTHTGVLGSCSKRSTQLRKHSIQTG